MDSKLHISIVSSDKAELNKVNEEFFRGNAIFEPYGSMFNLLSSEVFGQTIYRDAHSKIVRLEDGKYYQEVTINKTNQEAIVEYVEVSKKDIPSSEGGGVSFFKSITEDTLNPYYLFQQYNRCNTIKWYNRFKV